jgi:predicted ATPase
VIHSLTRDKLIEAVTDIRDLSLFHKILEKLSARVQGISNVKAKTTEEGRVLLRFQDGAFEDPFPARYVSDGAIKMFAYLLLLYDPNPHPLLCVEEPENQLYPKQLKAFMEDGDQMGYLWKQGFFEGVDPQ